MRAVFFKRAALIGACVLAVGCGSTGGDAPASVTPPPTTRTALTPDSVLLNFKTGDLTIVARVPRSAVDSAGTAFVWAFFINPGTTDGSWSDMPIRVRPDFSAGDTAVVRAVRERFGWWDNRDVPRDGYRARVFIGTDSAAVYQRASERDKDPALTVPVRSTGS